MAGRHISKKKVGEMVASMPVPVAQHLRRCRKLAEYLLDRAKEDQRFASLDLNEKELIAAVGAHDFGKFEIEKDFMYLRYCETSKERKIYYSHIDRALAYIEDNSLAYRANKTFDRYLYECCKFHHAGLDGSGVPAGLDGSGVPAGQTEIPFAGRLCAVVDAFDNALNVGSVAVGSFDVAVKSIKAAAGKSLDAELCQLLTADPQALEDFCRSLLAADKKARSKYGMTVQFAPVYRLEDKTLVGMDAIPAVNDPYFGPVEAKVFLPIAARTENIVQVDRIMRYRSLRQMELFLRHGVDIQRLRLQEDLRSIVKKGYLGELKRLLTLYEVPADKLAIGVSEEILLRGDSECFEALKAIADLGVYTYIYDFGNKCSAFTQLGELPVKELRLSDVLVRKGITEKNTFTIMQGLVKIAKELEITVTCGCVNNPEEERLLANVGLDEAGGRCFGQPRTAYMVEKEFGARVEDDE